MLHPVGSQPPSVYWRRRLLLAGGIVLLIVLIVLTAKAVGGGSASADPTSKPPASSGPTAPATHTSSSPAPRASSSTKSSPSASSSKQSSSPAKSSTSSSNSTPPTTCVAKQLTVSAVVGKSTYSTTEDPALSLQVVNKGPSPCVQDLADKQVELKVYNGVSRVWGSRDCAVQPNTDKRTLAVGTPYQVTINWSGKTSNTGCSKNDRQHVGAGSYTLYAALSGHTGKAARFTIK